jgi:hypothetical protein
MQCEAFWRTEKCGAVINYARLKRRCNQVAGDLSGCD